MTPATLTRCAHWTGAPLDCPHDVFESADGSTRCRGCHLPPDRCTCGFGRALLDVLVEAVARSVASEGRPCGRWRPRGDGLTPLETYGHDG